MYLTELMVVMRPGKKVVTKTCTIPSHGTDISAPLAKRLSKEHDLDLF